MSHVLERDQFIARPRREVFAFFSDAMNLERITPPFVNFKILTPAPIPMHAGTLIDYRIRLFGVPMTWRTRISAYEPEERFADTQERGPYRLWEHTHTFQEVPGGTQMHDRVVYELPMGPLGSIAHAAFVKRTLGKIFDYRREAIETIFEASAG